MPGFYPFQWITIYSYFTIIFEDFIKLTLFLLINHSLISFKKAFMKSIMWNTYFITIAFDSTNLIFLINHLLISFI